MSPRAWFAVLPLSCLVVFLGIFLFAADRSATDDLGVGFAYVGLLLSSLRLAIGMLTCLGIDPLVDVFERRNLRVIAPVAGALLGATALNVGANLGSGDSMTTTIFPLIVSLGLWISAVVLSTHLTPWFSSVTLEHKDQSGWRLAIFCFASSVPLARAAAGDWISASATVADLVGALPAVAALELSAWCMESRGATLNPSLQTAIFVALCGSISGISLWLPLASSW